MMAKMEGTSTVAPKATYFRRSQAGQASRLSEEAAESQKKTRSIRSRKFMRVKGLPVLSVGVGLRLSIRAAGLLKLCDA
jgi:hypothetical protein